MSVSSATIGRIALKSAIEYPLPADAQAHEIISPQDGLLLVSQQPSSALVKMSVDPATGRPIAAVKHIVGNPFDGLHGLCLSQRHPGLVWATLQFSSELLLLDPQGVDPQAPPRIVQRIPLPAPAKGPHGLIEDGDDLWTSCKDSRHVVRIKPDNPQDYQVIPCPPRPIFVAVHPQSNEVYTTLDQSSALLRISRQGEVQTLPIPAEMGATPVGMVPGPDGNLWFVLLGTAAGGQGRFGRILKCGHIDWFQIKAGAAAGAGLIHLAFAPDAQTPGAAERIFLLGSSMASPTALNAVFVIGMGGGYSQIETQQTIAFPSQASMTHRVLPTRHGLYATELGACAVVHLSPAYSPYNEGVNEMSDAYSLWGCGVPTQRVDY
jgi:hypothetical protein